MVWFNTSPMSSSSCEGGLEGRFGFCFDEESSLFLPSLLEDDRSLSDLRLSRSEFRPDDRLPSLLDRSFSFLSLFSDLLLELLEFL